MENKKYIHIKDDVSLIIQDDGAILECKDAPSVKLTGKNLIFLYFICQNQSIDEQVKNISSIFQCEKEEAYNQLSTFLNLLKNYCALSRENGKNVSFSTLKIERILRRKNLSSITERPLVPHTISFALTDSCYMNCIYCYANAKKSDNRVRAQVTIDCFKRLVDEAVAIGVSMFELTGGDPFCVENIVEYCEILVKSKIDWLTSTKAYISPSLAKQLEKIGVKKLQVSLDSFNPNTVNYLTNRKNGYTVIMNTIRNLQEHHIAVRIKAVISSVNIKEIPEFVRFLDDKGISEVAFSWYGSLCGRSNLNLYPKQEDILWLNNQMAQLKNETKIRMDYEEISSNLFIFLESPLSYKHVFRKKCGASKYRMTINSKGDMCFCEYLESEKALIIGNIADNSIIELWNSPALNAIFNPSKEKFKNSDCYSCELFENCNERRCFLRSKRRYGTIFDKDPWCKNGDERFCEY